MANKHLVFNSILIIAVATFSVRFMQYKKNLNKHNLATNKQVLIASIPNSTPIAQNLLPQKSVPSKHIAQKIANQNVLSQNPLTLNASPSNIVAPTVAAPLTVVAPQNILPEDKIAQNAEIQNLITPTPVAPSTATATRQSGGVASQGMGLVAASLFTSSFYVGVSTSVTTTQNLPGPLYGGSVILGFKPIKFLAAEVNYSYMSGSQYGAEVSTNSLGMAVKGVLGLGDASVYAKVGAAYQTVGSTGEMTGVNCSSTSLCNGSSNNYPLSIVGIGASYSITNNIEMKVENAQYTPTTPSVTGGMNSSTLGVQYGF